MRTIFTKTIIVIFFLLSLFSCSPNGKLDPNKEIDDGESKGNLIVKALDNFHNDIGHYPDRLVELVPVYITEIPKTLVNQDFTFHTMDGDIYVVSFPVIGLKDVGTGVICTFIKRLGSWDCSFSVE